MIVFLILHANQCKETLYIYNTREIQSCIRIYTGYSVALCDRELSQRYRISRLQHMHAELQYLRKNVINISMLR